MNRKWKIVIHEPPWEFAESLRKRDRDRLRSAFATLKAHPFAETDAEVQTPNDRTHSIRNLQGFRIRYWLDLVVGEVVIVNIERA